MLAGAKRYLRSPTGKLALTYMAIIMTMTVVFSMVIFLIASRQFDRPLPPRMDMHMSDNGEAVQSAFRQRADDAKTELFVSLLFLNLAMLGFGAWFSMYLAKLTMDPIEQAMQEQSRFVTDASHELRTPLTAIRSMNEVVLRRKNITDKDARELAGKNVQEVTKLHALTTSLLGLVHTEKGGSALRPVGLQECVGEAMESVVAAAQQRGISVEDSVPNVTVLSQPEQLCQVIRILIDNAVKYSHDKGTVRISGSRTGAAVTLFVEDDGVGISKADLPHIFARFYRADESRSKERRSGFGLGLAIAKTISDRLGMRITAESQPGKGSRFSITLPLYNETKDRSS